MNHPSIISCLSGVDVSSFNSIYNKAKKKIDSGKFKILSLDVFDTIFHRTCPPNAVIDAVFFYVKSECEKLGLITDIKTISWARGEAYLRCANENAISGLDQETHVDEFFPLWMDLIGVSPEYIPEITKSVSDYELQLEESVLKVDSGIAQLVRYAASKGLRVIYCSDMYLPASFVNLMLDKYGLLDLFSGRYISSEPKLLKRTGKLFDYVLSKENVPAGTVLHIGDNVVSDYVKSRSKGITGIWLKDTIYQLRRYSLEYDHLNLHNHASYPLLLAEQGRFDTMEKNPGYLVGRNSLGPIYTSFISDVKDKAKELAVDKIFFLAREGYALKKIYDHISSDDLDAPEGVYIAGSRILSFLYSIDNGIGLRHLSDIFSNTSTYTVSNLLAPFSVDSELVISVCQKYGIDPHMVLPSGFLEWPPFIRILEDKDLNESIMGRVTEHCEMYTHYLKEAGLIGKSKVMVVDVGWGGQIQDNLFRGLQLAGHEPDLLIGCYMALNGKAHQRKQPHNWKHATHADKGILEWNGYSCFDTVFIYEAAVRASHATVLGFERIGNDVVPLLKSDASASRRVEKNDDPYLAEIQRGIIDFASSFSLVDKLYPNISKHHLKPYALTCISIVSRFPEFWLHSRLAEVGNVADLGTDHVNVAGANITKAFSFDIIRLLRNNPWKEFVAFNKLGFPGLLLLTLYRNFRSIPKLNSGLVPSPLFNFPKTDFISSDLSESQNLNLEFEDSLFKLAESSHYSASDLGKKLSPLVSPRQLIINDKVMVYNYLMYRVVNLVLRLNGRHHFHYDGMSAKYIVKRRIYALRRAAKDYIKYLLSI